MLGARIGGFINKHLPSHITLPLLSTSILISVIFYCLVEEKHIFFV